MTAQRTCRVCETGRPLTSFPKSAKGYRAWTCNSCKNARIRAARALANSIDQSVKVCADCCQEKSIKQFPLRNGYRQPRCYTCTGRVVTVRRVTQFGSHHRYWRVRAIERLGGHCECCGETEYAFLEIHHREGGGRQHRSGLHGQLERWAATADDPSVVVGLFCANCHRAISSFGVCPHRAPMLEVV